MNHEQDRYEQAVAYLYTFVNYERKMAETYAPEKMDPSRPGRLLAYLDNPHQQYPAIHIAGTKGKGSVAAMCAHVLRAAGLRVGLYTSPHLQDVRERIRVLTPAGGDDRITCADFADGVTQLQAIIPREPGVTWFELMTALAFCHFARQAVDVAVVEVGLGGRLDATNILTPQVSVITNLALEHTELLGNTLAAIAGEKGGIIKPGVPVVTAPQAPEALATLQAIAAAQHAPLLLATADWRCTAVPFPAGQGQTLTIQAAPDPAFVGQSFTLALAGAHQQENCLVALAALHQVQPLFPTLTLAAVRQGLADVQWPGRLQTLHRRPDTPTLLLDAAHTAGSAEKLAQALQTLYDYRRLWLVLGITAEKDVTGILQALLPLAAGTVVSQANHPRAIPPAELQQAAGALGYVVTTRPDIPAAVRAAWAAARPGDLICVTGSLFVVGDLLNCWDSLQSELLTTTEVAAHPPDG